MSTPLSCEVQNNNSGKTERGELPEVCLVNHKISKKRTSVNLPGKSQRSQYRIATERHTGEQNWETNECCLDTLSMC